MKFTIDKEAKLKLYLKRFNKKSDDIMSLLDGVDANIDDLELSSGRFIDIKNKKYTGTICCGNYRPMIKIDSDNVRFRSDGKYYTYVYVNNDESESKAQGIFIEYITYDEDDKGIIVEQYYDEFTLSYLYGLCHSIKGIIDSAEHKKIGNYGLIPDKENIYDGYIDYNEISKYLKDNNYFANKIINDDMKLKKKP